MNRQANPTAGVDRAAGEYATARVPQAAPGQTVDEVRQALGGRQFEAAQDVVVLAGGRALGLASMEALLEAEPTRPISELMNHEPPTVIGAVFFAFVALGWGDLDVATAVGLALLASCSIATLVAMVLPSIFQRFGRDPAFGSGPLATVIQDVLSILVYLAVVAAVV